MISVSQSEGPAFGYCVGTRAGVKDQSRDEGRLTTRDIVFTVMSTDVLSLKTRDIQSPHESQRCRAPVDDNNSVMSPPWHEAFMSRERGDVLILSPASYAMPISPLSSDTYDPSDSVEKCAMAWNKTVSVVIRIWENCLLFKCTQSAFVVFQSIGLQGANNQTRTHLLKMRKYEFTENIKWIFIYFSVFPQLTFQS